MTKKTMINHYRKHSAADAYIIGYVYNGLVFFNIVEEIMPRFLNIEEASRNQGQNLRLRLKAKHRKALYEKGGCYLCTADELKTEKYNKGEIFEKLVTEFFGQEWEKDTVPFWKQGDINIDGKEMQIKLDTATLTNTKQIEKLKRR